MNGAQQVADSPGIGNRRAVRGHYRRKGTLKIHGDISFRASRHHRVAQYFASGRAHSVRSLVVTAGFDTL